MLSKGKTKNFIKEAVLKYNDFEAPTFQGKVKLQCLDFKEKENPNFLMANQSRSHLRPTSAVRPGSAIPQQAISTFDQFNRDILDHKIANESVKRLKPKLAVSKTRVHSANRKMHLTKAKNARVPSGNLKVKNNVKKMQRPTTAFRTSSKMGFTERVERDAIINVKIPM